MCLTVMDARNSGANTPLLKQHYRETILHIFHLYTRALMTNYVGIRLNGLASSEFERDIAMLAGLNVHLENLTLFLPKVEKFRDIQYLQIVLDASGIPFMEIIPVMVPYSSTTTARWMRRFCISFRYMTAVPLFRSRNPFAFECQ